MADHPTPSSLGGPETRCECSHDEAMHELGDDRKGFRRLRCVECYCPEFRAAAPTKDSPKCPDCGHAMTKHDEYGCDAVGMHCLCERATVAGGRDV